MVSSLVQSPMTISTRTSFEGQLFDAAIDAKTKGERVEGLEADVEAREAFFENSLASGEDVRTVLTRLAEANGVWSGGLRDDEEVVVARPFMHCLTSGGMTNLLLASYDFCDKGRLTVAFFPEVAIALPL